MIRHCVLTSTVLLLLCGTVPAKDPETTLQPQLIVSTALSKSFTLYDNAVLLPDGSELTLLRQVDVKISSTDEEFAKGPDPKKTPPVWMHVRLGAESISRTRFTVEERMNTSIHVRVYLPRRGGGKPVLFEELFSGRGDNRDASRLDALKQMDTRLRDKIGRTLATDEKILEKELKLEIHFENPYQIPIAGLLHRRTTAVKERDRDVRFRLAPGEKQVRYMPLIAPYEAPDPKNAYSARERIDAFFTFPTLF